MKNKKPLINKSMMDTLNITLSIPMNAIVFIFSTIATLGMFFNRDWSFVWTLGIVVYSGINLRSIFSLMDYPDEKDIR